MRTIKQIEVSEITSGTNIEILWEDLVNTYPNMDMSFGVELYGSPEHGNTTGIDDAPAIEIIKKLSKMKFGSVPNGYMPYKTAIHLNHGYADMFNKKRDFRQSKIWNLVQETNVDKVVYNFNTLTDEQKEMFSTDNFYDFLQTKANPFYNQNINYFVVLNSETTSDFLLDKVVWALHNDPRQDYLKRIKSLVFENKFEDWVPSGIERKNDHYQMTGIHIAPASWCGGISPDNVKDALSTLNQKLENKIEKIDISARGGVMTHGKTDLDKVYQFMQNANDWQMEFNQRNNANIRK